MKLKRGRPVKKKPIEKISGPLPVEVLQEILAEEPEMIASAEEKSKTPLCECGKEVQAGNHQCWTCAHRP